MPSSQGSPPANDKIELHCNQPYCRSVITGTSKFAKINFKRHLRTVHPLVRKEWPCLIEGCETVIRSNREDNLWSHRWLVHGIIKPGGKPRGEGGRRRASVGSSPVKVRRKATRSYSVVGAI